MGATLLQKLGRVGHGRHGADHAREGTDGPGVVRGTYGRAPGGHAAARAGAHPGPRAGAQEGGRAGSGAGSAPGWYSALARTGLVAKGVSYGLVGGLAVAVAAGQGGATTSREGALQSIAGHGWGKVLIALLAVGFAAYAGWRIVQAVRGSGDRGAKEWGKRASYAARAAIYLALTASAVRLLVDGGGSGGGAGAGGGAGGGGSQTEKAHKTTAVVLDWPGGRWIVGAAGVAIAAAGLWNLYRGVTRKFEKRWRRGEMAPAERRWGGRAGVAGHAARCVVFGLIGAFAVKAAVEYDPNQAIGLDGALRKLAHQAWGPWLLGLTAAGLLCYGVYCLADARFRDVEAG